MNDRRVRAAYPRLDIIKCFINRTRARPRCNSCTFHVSADIRGSRNSAAVADNNAHCTGLPVVMHVPSSVEPNFHSSVRRDVPSST